MNRYCITIIFQNPKEKLEYYLAIRNDDLAKKYFLFKMFRLIKTEQLQFDKVLLSYDGFKIVAYYEEKEYIAAMLSCVPNRFKIVNIPKLEQYNLEDMLKYMKKECNIKIGSPK